MLVYGLIHGGRSSLHGEGMRYSPALRSCCHAWRILRPRYSQGSASYHDKSELLQEWPWAWQCFHLLHTQQARGAGGAQVDVHSPCEQSDAVSGRQKLGAGSLTLPARGAPAASSASWGNQAAINVVSLLLWQGRR